MTVQTATQLLGDLSLKEDKTDSTSKFEQLNGQGGYSNGSRRRFWAPRIIPRESPARKDSRRQRPHRRRLTSESSPRQHRPVRPRTTSEMSSMSEPAKDALSTKKLRDTVAEKFDKKGSNMLASYLKNRRELTTFESKTKFLQQCKAVEVVPVPYRLSNNNIKNTKVIRRILDKFSLQTMFAVLIHCRKRCDQIKRLLDDRTVAMTELFGEELAKDVIAVADEVSERRALQLNEKSAEHYNNLIAEYKLSEKDIKIGQERLKVFEQLDKERQERRLQRIKEKVEAKPDARPEAKPEMKSESQPDNVSEGKPEPKLEDGDKGEPEGEKQTQE